MPPSCTAAGLLRPWARRRAAHCSTGAPASPRALCAPHAPCIPSQRFFAAPPGAAPPASPPPRSPSHTVLSALPLSSLTRRIGHTPALLFLPATPRFFCSSCAFTDVRGWELRLSRKGAQLWDGNGGIRGSMVDRHSHRRATAFLPIRASLLLACQPCVVHPACFHRCKRARAAAAGGNAAAGGGEQHGMPTGEAGQEGSTPVSHKERKYVQRPLGARPAALPNHRMHEASSGMCQAARCKPQERQAAHCMRLQ